MPRYDTDLSRDMPYIHRLRGTASASVPSPTPPTPLSSSTHNDSIITQLVQRFARAFVDCVVIRWS
jgi:hypothetical protein